MANVQIIEGKKDVATAIDGGDAEIFGYRLNRVGFATVVGFGVLMLAGATYTWWQAGFGAPLWTAIILGLVAGAIFLGAQAAYWYAFAKTRFVAVSGQKLYVGRLHKAWALDWQILDAERLGFEQMDASAVSGSLDIEVGGEEIEVHLYNAYVFLDDIQGLIFRLLKQLQRKKQEDEEAAGPDDEAASAR